jgi:hypothetical protein
MPAIAFGTVASHRRNEAGTWVNAVSGVVSRPISAAMEGNVGPESQVISLARRVVTAARAAASAPATAAVARRAVGMGVGVGLRGGGGFVGTSPSNDVNDAYEGTAGRFARSGDDDGKELGR